MVQSTADPRERLLSAGLKLFAEKGYSATSVSEIVSAAGVSKPMLYYYFSSKEGIYLELMQFAFSQLQAVLKNREDEHLFVAERIIRLFCDILDLAAMHSDSTKLIYSMVYGPSEGAPFFNFEVYHKSMLETISNILKEGVIKGEIENIDTDDFALIMLSLLFFCVDTNMIKFFEPMGAAELRRLVSGLFDKIVKEGKGI